MKTFTHLSMDKAVDYLGSTDGAHQLLATLQKTLAADALQIEQAIQGHDFAQLQMKWHQLKGFAPVFCQDALLAEIVHTEKLCQHTHTTELATQALQWSTQLLAKLQTLQAEVALQLKAAD
jgi:hypothetical protein